MTPDGINGARLFVLSSAAADLAPPQANRDRVRETPAKDVAVRAMVAPMVTPLSPVWLLASSPYELQRVLENVKLFGAVK